MDPLVDPPLPVVAQQTDRIGVEAVKLLLGVMAGETGPRTLRVAVQLMAEPAGDLQFLQSVLNNGA
jgi:DNA-binding LacI/PurR family transcriptional regulator